MLVSGDPEPTWTLFRTAMADLGLVAGKTVIYEYRAADSASGKLDAYVTRDVEYDPGVCLIEEGDLAGWTRTDYTVTLTNRAPTGLPDYVDLRLDRPGAPEGSTKLLVTVLGPAQAVEEAVSTNGQLADYVSGHVHDRPYWLGEVELARGQTSDLTVTWAEPPVGDGARVTTRCPMAVG